MLNTAAPAASQPLSGLVAPQAPAASQPLSGLVAPQAAAAAAGESAPGFAQELDRAESQQRDALPGQGRETREQPGPAEAAADGVEQAPSTKPQDRPATQGAQRKALPRPGLPTATEAVAAESAAVRRKQQGEAPASTDPLAAQSAAENPMRDADPIAASFDLAALVPGLVPPKPVPAPAAGTATGRAVRAAQPADARPADAQPAIRELLDMPSRTGMVAPDGDEAQAAGPALLRPPAATATAVIDTSAAIDARRPPPHAAVPGALAGEAARAAGLTAGVAARREGAVEPAPASPPFGAVAQAIAPGASNLSPAIGTPFQAELHAALGSPQFAPALGAQLSVLAREGIQQAQLHLNPAEMGPIGVRISLDGNQAQVDFTAAHALTRQALEEAVPALASALREAGLTLTGGGVFQQPREPRGDGQPGRGNGSTRQAGSQPEQGLALERGTVISRARGVLDLYA